MSDTIDNSDYDTFQSALEKYISERPRYARFPDRRDSGDMSVDTMLNSAHGRFQHAALLAPKTVSFSPYIPVIPCKGLSHGVLFVVII